MKSVAQLNWMCICQLTAQTRKAKKAELEAQATTNEPKAEAKTIEPPTLKKSIHTNAISAACCGICSVLCICTIPLLIPVLVAALVLAVVSSLLHSSSIVRCSSVCVFLCVCVCVCMCVCMCVWLYGTDKHNKLRIHSYMDRLTSCCKQYHGHINISLSFSLNYL